MIPGFVFDFLDGGFNDDVDLRNPEHFRPVYNPRGPCGPATGAGDGLGDMSRESHADAGHMLEPIDSRDRQGA